MKLTPFHHILAELPEDGSKVILAQIFIDKVKHYLEAEVQRVTNESAMEALRYLHKNNVVTITEMQVNGELVKFINKKVTNGN